MKNLLAVFVLVIAITASCTDDGTDAVRERVGVDVVESIIPTEAQVKEVIQIYVTAQATNGCYSDLKPTLTEMGESKRFLIKATGLFVSRGACPDVLVSKDFVINFTPESPGEYTFQVNEAPFKVREYTLNVK